MLGLQSNFVEIEDEVHFIFYCSVNGDLRATLLSEMSFNSDEIFCMGDFICRALDTICCLCRELLKTLCA